MRRTHCHFCDDSEELEGLLILNSSFLLFFVSAIFRAFMPSPEELAREKIDASLEQCSWILQSRSTINLSASRGVAIREALLKGRDEVDYLLFVDGKAIGTVEAKPEGFTLTGVEEQSGKYGKSLLDIYPKWHDPLPFAYESTGTETRFTAKSRRKEQQRQKEERGQSYY
jgi:type I site-specific restriction endonuclease